MICVWRVFSHYKLPLWAESHADPRKIQANTLTDQWRQRVTHNLQRQAMYSSHRYRVYTSMLPKSTLHAVKQNDKTGCLKSSIWMEKLHLTQVGINTYHRCTGIRPLRSSIFIHHCWFPFLHSPLHTITRCSQSWECKHVIFGVFQWLDDVTFQSRSEC